MFKERNPGKGERGLKREQAIRHLLLEGLAFEMVSSQGLGMCLCLVLAGRV